MKLKIKLLSKGSLAPKKINDADAGLDLIAISCKVGKKFIEYGTGIAVEFPKNHVGLLFPRSSISNKDLSLANSVGVIDSSYRGEIKVRFKRTWINPFARLKMYFRGEGPSIYNLDDRIAQLVIVPIAKISNEDIQIVQELTETSRGENGFGSTGK